MWKEYKNYILFKNKIIKLIYLKVVLKINEWMQYKLEENIKYFLLKQFVIGI